MQTTACVSSLRAPASGFKSCRAQRPARCLVVRAEAGKNLRETLLGAAAIGVASLLVAAGPSHAGLDTSTTKKGEAAKIEYSRIEDESPEAVVKKLKYEVLPDVFKKLGADADQDGSTYPKSVVQEFKTVAQEVDALERQVKAGGRGTNIKSLASGIEQQINALKANLGFD
ncbi:hypothetical protein N2152v2_007150 [Parachlorella kessleri]